MKGISTLKFVTSKQGSLSENRKKLLFFLFFLITNFYIYLYVDK